MDNTERLLRAFIEAQGYEIEEVTELVLDGCGSFEDELVDYKLTKKKRTHKIREVTYSDEFEQAWKLYPKKQGNKKMAAYQAWRARIAENISNVEQINVMIQMAIGTKRYAAYHKALGTEERFIHQGSTFYGRERLYMQDWTIPKEQLRLPADDKLEAFARENGLTWPAPQRLRTMKEYRELLTKELGERNE